MRPVHVLVAPADGHLEVLVQYIQSVQGRSEGQVLLVSAATPYRDLHNAFVASGVTGVTVLDLLSSSLGVVPPDASSDAAVFVPSPTMLEMTAMRVEQIHRRMGGDVHVIVDSLDRLVMYSSRKAVEEFTHYLVNRLRSIGASGDLIVTRTTDGDALSDAARPYTDGTLPLEEMQ